LVYIAIKGESVMFDNRYENYEDIINDSDELFSYEDVDNAETNIYHGQEWDHYYHNIANEIVDE
jgi:hypothetical protein